MIREALPRSPASAALLVQFAQSRGTPPETCLKGTRLTLGDLRNPATEVDARQELRIISNIVDALHSEPGLGLEVGRQYHLTTYGIWGFALISSPTLRDAIDVGLRFVGLTFAFCQITARQHGDEVWLVLDPSEAPVAVRRFVTERDSAAITTLQQELFAQPVPARRVTFTFPEPDDGIERYAETFGVTPIFGAEENTLAIDPAFLDQPLPQANEYARAIAQSQCRDLLNQRKSRAGLSGQVRDLLLANPAQPLTLDEVARELHTSTRTVRRQLASEGTSLRALINEIREGLAEELLITGRMPVADVAHRLGYLEVSSFSQAFRRWKGLGPREYRARVSGAR
ncbi:AraC family transcriptional regulator [Hoyosella sp. YIM 151337]|uniref:AraC family transcriptional regulator n=1 Tax=Hoyosella sp. YIM 151337 TaxID=2992742 RepID=UPI0022368722|nr:AraC family transcriptional regulator [Hoyosella sp. YIM 151337]MCW4355920.1 AraC family transcriptional regulator [Hoyosella sp. YIM 151337]